MIDFDFVSPTKLFFGRGKEKDIGAIIKSYGFKKILFHYGGGSIKSSGLYQTVVSSLNKNNVEYVELGGVRINPTHSLVRAGVFLAQKEKIDFILAVGGGSVIDSTKAIAVGFYYEGDPFDFNLHLAQPKQSLPVGVILTISAAGSELSSSCVISNDETGTKRGFNSDLIRPLFAVCNPELTYSVNKYQTGCGIVDIISHSFERYFSPSEQKELADEFALGVIRHVVEVGKIAIDNPKDYEARASLMLASTFSHNGVTGLGKKVNMPIHAIAHGLSGYDPNIAHGAALSVMIPAWMAYVKDAEIDKFAAFGREVFKIHFVNKDESANIGIRELRNFFQEIGMPVTLRELGIDKQDIPRLVEMITENGTRVVGHSVRPLDARDIEALLLSCL
ncbi:MAG: iron-containing alcohol dehydrogenase [Bacilli bacterium]